MQKAKIGDTVKIHFTCKLEDDTVIDSSIGREPLQFTVGDGQMIPGLEQAIVGMGPKESKTVKILPDEGFGLYHKELVKTTDRKEYREEVEPQVGLQFQVHQADGKTGIATVVDVSEKTVTLDANHPLAGKILFFDIEIVDVLQFNPVTAEEYHHLGIVLYNNGEYDGAIKNFQKALEANPNIAEAYNYMGNALQESFQFDEAISCYEKAIQLNPADPTSYINAGIALNGKKQFGEAITYYQKALRLNPNLAQTYYYMGISFMEQGKIEEAIQNYKHSLRINPDSASALCNLGNAILERGELKEAETLYRHAMQTQPDNLAFYQALLMILNYDSGYDARTVLAEHLEFAKKYAYPLYPAFSPRANIRVRSRRLRIGYVSPDFRRHSVAYFIEPVLRSHDHEQFEVLCYSNVLIPDEVTKRIHTYAGQWRDIRGISHQMAAEMIRKDGIDILVDLAGHTANNRILLFALKPAPVQVTWIGYPATTGLSTMDYKIVDNYTDPPGMTEQFYTEKLIRMPESFLCYLPDRESPEIKELPALSAGYITFGSFNNFAKVSPEVLALWIKVLKALPGSHLLMKTRGFSDGVTRQYVLDKFTSEGIDAERVEMLPWETSSRQHLDLYNQVDIGLDTFPYNGTTTTCEAMWMGVPVITFAGNTHASRTGVSLLSNVGLAEFIARTHEAYLETAVYLASDMERLRLLRKRLRDIVASSPLAEARRFTQNLEICYRRMWERYCDSG